MPFLFMVPAFVWKIIATVVLVGGVYLSIEKSGERKALAKVETANNEADKRGQDAASNSGKRTSRSVRDPHTRVD
jgi:predicted DNA repair protein MutK